MLTSKSEAPKNQTSGRTLGQNCSHGHISRVRTTTVRGDGPCHLLLGELAREKAAVTERLGASKCGPVAQGAVGEILMQGCGFRLCVGLDDRLAGVAEFGAEWLESFFFDEEKGMIPPRHGDGGHFPHTSTMSADVISSVFMRSGPKLSKPQGLIFSVLARHCSTHALNGDAVHRPARRGGEKSCACHCFRL